MQFQDRLTEDAFTEVATLLATAYQRYIAARCQLPKPPASPATKELDKSGPSSPHGQ